MRCVGIGSAVGVVGNAPAPQLLAQLNARNVALVIRVDGGVEIRHAHPVGLHVVLDALEQLAVLSDSDGVR